MTWSFFVGRLNHIWEERDGGESEIRDKGQREAERWRDRDHICNVCMHIYQRVKEIFFFFPFLLREIFFNFSFSAIFHPPDGRLSIVDSSVLFVCCGQIQESSKTTLDSSSLDSSMRKNPNNLNKVETATMKAMQQVSKDIKKLKSDLALVLFVHVKIFPVFQWQLRQECCDRD